MAFDKARTAQGIAGVLDEDPALNVATVEPAVGRVTPPPPETAPPGRPRRRRQPVRMRTTSVAFDEDLLDWLKVLVAGERGLTQRGVIRELVARLKAAPAAERRAVLDAAYEWEREAT